VRVQFRSSRFESDYSAKRVDKKGKKEKNKENVE
jgi:hypothetical protein